MPAVVVQSTETVCPLAVPKVTVNDAVVLPALPSAVVASAMLNEGTASSFVIVPVPAEPTVAFTGVFRVREKVSSASLVLSPFTGTFTVFVVWPAVNVRVPEVVV